MNQTYYNTKTKLKITATIRDKCLKIYDILTLYLTLHRDNDEEANFPQVRQVLDELGLSNVSTEDCKTLKTICRVVSTRAAYLASAGTTNNITLNHCSTYPNRSIHKLSLWPSANVKVVAQVYAPEVHVRLFFS